MKAAASNSASGRAFVRSVFKKTPYFVWCSG
jgi:hypothetical protein